MAHLFGWTLNGLFALQKVLTNRCDGPVNPIAATMATLVEPMRVLPVVLLVLCVSSAGAAEDAAAQEDTATLWAALRAGGHVALVRHGATGGGAGDPPGFRLDDCATQRNLIEKGRAEARRLGEQFRSEDVAVAKLISSQWWPVPRDGGVDGPWSGRTLPDLQQRLHVA